MSFYDIAHTWDGDWDDDKMTWDPVGCWMMPWKQNGSLNRFISLWLLHSCKVTQQFETIVVSLFLINTCNYHETGWLSVTILVVYQRVVVLLFFLFVQLSVCPSVHWSFIHVIVNILPIYFILSQLTVIIASSFLWTSQLICQLKNLFGFVLFDSI